MPEPMAIPGGSRTIAILDASKKIAIQGGSNMLNSGVNSKREITELPVAKPPGLKSATQPKLIAVGPMGKELTVKAP